MPKLVITCGVSGSGKSTYAEGLPDWYEINRDRFRFELYCNGQYDWSLYKFTKDRENNVTRECELAFEDATSLQMNIIVSNTNLNQKDHDYWEKKASFAGYDFEVKYFPITLSEAIKRDKKRGALAVGQDVLFDQWEKWLKITNAPRYVPNEFKQKAIICDIDGTIALTTTRSHYDYSEAVLTDKARYNVIQLVEGFADANDALIICVSGREDKCRNYTKQWLDNLLFDFSGLLMRKAGDSRSDCIVKEEIFWQDIEPYYNVIAAFDDRPRIIRKWKDIGIPLVVDVSKTYKEF